MPRYSETLGIRRTSQSNGRQVLPTPMMAHIKANASATVAGACGDAHGCMSILTPREVLVVAVPLQTFVERGAGTSLRQVFTNAKSAPGWWIRHGSCH